MAKLENVSDDTIVLAAATLAAAFAHVGEEELRKKEPVEREQAFRHIYGWAIRTVIEEVRELTW